MNELLQRARDFLVGAPLPTDDPGTVVEWVQLSDPSRTQEILVWVLIGLILLATLWNLRRARGIVARVALLLLRGAVVAVLLFAFYQPALLEERRARSTNTILLLVDDSASMALPQGDGTRRDLAAEFIRDHAALWKRIEETNAVESYRFSDSLVATDWRDMDRLLEARGPNTHIVEVLEEVRDRFRNRDIGGIVLLTDGIDNGRASRALRQGAGPDQETLELLRSLGTPVHTFGIEDATVKDVSVHELRYSPFAFKRNRASIEAEIEVHGYTEGDLEIELLEEGKLLRTATRPLQPEKQSYTATFDFTPEEMGQRVYTVRVKPFPAEVTLENNERHAVIRINRDKIRVLQIAGHPSWDVRFLRNHLKRTPNIQLISFFILINTGSTLGTVKSGETSLIPFPAEELFAVELGGFDLVVLQDFNYGPFSTPQHLHRIRDYVKHGGALVMVGGRLALGAGGYDRTELDEILPVRMTVPDFEEDALDQELFTPQLTVAGKTHTVTRLSYDAAENQAIWARLPVLEGLNKTRGLKNGGIALVEHPRLKGEGSHGMPVIAVNEPGKGRAAVVATDSFWRWKLPAVGEGQDDKHYDRLWGNLIRWLIRDPELDLVRVTPSAGVRALGESVVLEVRIFEPDYRPAGDHGFSMVVKRRPRPGPGETPQVVYEARALRTDDQGRWQQERTMQGAGVYDVTVRSVVAGQPIAATTVFVVSDERPEMREVRTDGRLLEAIATATGGANHTLTERNVSLRFNPPRVSDVTSRRYHERWNVPGVFALACLLFGLEWWLRRRIGLV